MAEYYQRDEEKGRKKYECLCKEQSKTWCNFKRHTTDKYSPYDTVIISGAPITGTQQTMVEIKCRAEVSTKYPTWFLEVQKYDELKKIQKQVKKETGRTKGIQYTNFFTDNVAYSWNLTDINSDDLRVTLEWCPINDYSSEMVLKKVYHLLPETADKYTLPTNK